MTGLDRAGKARSRWLAVLVSAAVVAAPCLAIVASTSELASRLYLSR